MLNHIAAKFTICLLALAILLTGCSSAKTEFTFRDLQWGMSKDQVVELEAQKEDSTLFMHDTFSSFAATQYGHPCSMDYFYGDASKDNGGNEGLDIIVLSFDGLTLDEIDDICTQLKQDYPPKEYLAEGLNFKSDSVKILSHIAEPSLIIMFYAL